MPESDWQTRRSEVIRTAGKVLRTLGRIDQVGPVETGHDSDRTINHATYLSRELIELRDAVAALRLLLPPE